MSEDVHGPRVAVVGSGLTGIVAAHILSLVDVHVDIFERSSRIGMDSESVDVEGDGGIERIDVPMRAFSRGYYPELTRLYHHLGIDFKPTNFSFSFALGSGPQVPVPSFVYDGRMRSRRFHFPTAKKNACSAFWDAFLISASYVMLIVLAMYHSWRGNTRNNSHRLARVTFGEWASASALSDVFICALLLPMMSSVLTANMDAVANTPANEMLEYVARSFLSEHFTVANGVQNVVTRLTAPVPKENIHLGVNIDAISIEGPTVTIHTSGTGGDDVHEGYTHVVFATPTPVSASMISQLYEPLPFDDLRRRLADMHHQLQQLRYVTSTVVVHSDKRVLPPAAQLWRDLNFVSPCIPSSPMGVEAATMASHIVWRKDERVLVQTTNPLPELMPEQQHTASRSEFPRFVLSVESNAARKSFFCDGSLGKLQGSLGPKCPAVYVCGSWTAGIPLLEGCVSSARLVSTDILVRAGHTIEHVSQWSLQN